MDKLFVHKKYTFYESIDFTIDKLNKLIIEIRLYIGSCLWKEIIWINT